MIGDPITTSVLLLLICCISYRKQLLSQMKVVKGHEICSVMAPAWLRIIFLTSQSRIIIFDLNKIYFILIDRYVVAKLVQYSATHYTNIL